MSREPTKDVAASAMDIRSTRELAPGAESRTELILDSYRSWLRRILSRLRPRGLSIDVDDVEQEVSIKLWRALRSEKEIDDLPSYLYRVASTTTIDAMRRAHSRRDSATTRDMGIVEAREGPERSPEELAASALLLGRIEKALETLPENRRRAVALHLQGFTTREVADLLGFREPKARNLVYRGLKSLQLALREEGIENARG